jgi:hypothetical protein
MTKQWVKVVDEMSTLDMVLKGYSIARYGDGELKLADGGDCISQVHTIPLQKELRKILQNKNKNCIVGLPNYVESPKKWFWDKVCTRQKYMNFLDYNTTYYSQFITRLDSAPWINTKTFWKKMNSLWDDKDVILVGGSDKALGMQEYLKGAKSVSIVKGTRRDSYSEINRIEREILAMPQKTVLMCLGATATCLAARLAEKNKHAIDLGHITMFMSDKWYAQNPPKDE